MARYRLSGPAKADLSRILRVSQTLHGAEARIRYRGLLTAAMRRVAADPQGLATLGRGELSPGLRSLHIGRARDLSREAPAAAPAHVIFFRVHAPGLVEIVRVLHVRTEPSGRLGEAGASRRDD